MYATHIKCVNCLKHYPISAGPFICPDCGEEYVGPVRVLIGLEEVVYDYSNFSLTKEELSSRQDRTIWKFKEFLPLKDMKNIVSLGEGGTPMIHVQNLSSQWGIKNLYVKNEGMNPTGSFKDRETSVMISMARELGVKKVTITSSGNAGGAVAAYSNAAGLEAICFVPISFSPRGKRATYAAYNPAALIGIRGHYEDVNNISVEMGIKHGWYITNHGFNPYRMEGDKTIAYELCMDLGWRAPDHVIVPTGSGGNLAGEWKGFKEFYDLGWIKNLPRMTAIQVEAGAPLVEAIQKGLDKVKPDLDAGASAADGVISKYDDYAALALKAIRESGGTAIAVSEEAIIKAERLLAKKEGIFVEPSAAVAVAGCQKLNELGEIDQDEVTIIIATATGLKNPDIVLEGFQFPLELDSTPDTIRLVEEYLEHRG
jgi:threonine synthase